MATSDEIPAPAPESRFTVSPLTLAADRWMGRLIRIGGVGVVVAVLGMLGFLIFQVFPLFVGAKVSPQSALTVPAEAVARPGAENGSVSSFSALCPLAAASVLTRRTAGAPR